MFFVISRIIISAIDDNIFNFGYFIVFDGDANSRR
jgi:hypothetical protein